MRLTKPHDGVLCGGRTRTTVSDEPGAVLGPSSKGVSCPRMDTTASFLEEQDPDLLFQLLYLAAQRRLRHVEPLGRTAKLDSSATATK